MSAPTPVYSEDVRKLRSEAAQAGDLRMVAICDLALDHSDDSPVAYAAWDECERVIRDARAQW
jgi:hypothetical protein